MSDQVRKLTLGLKERFASYIEPYQPLSYAFHFLWKAFRSGGSSSAQDRAFAQWYQELGPHFVNFENTTTLPSLASTAHGTVLELGPGTGNQLARYNLDKVIHIYGIESNVAFAEPLNAKIDETKLGDKYTPIFCRIEDIKVLEMHGITKESVDCITSFQVLCSVKKPTEVVAHLWRLLKPEGELIFWEHEMSVDWLTWLVQKLWTPAWRFAVGGCRLDRPITDILLKSANWEVIELKHEGERWSIMPRVWGRLRKVDGQQAKQV